MAQRGTLFLVAGPSGAGKDSLIAAARAAFAEDPHYVFPRRHITRPEGAGGEDHIEVSPAVFETAKREGAYSLTWRSHGLSYGIPVGIEEALSDGSSVVINVSRAVLDEVRRRFQPAKIVLVTAPPHVLAERLSARGRESAADVFERMERAHYAPPSGPDVVTIENSGKLADAAKAFIAALCGEGRN